MKLGCAKPARLLGSGLLVSVLAMTAGCSSGGTVSGQVTYKGELVRGGTVVFYGANNWTGNAVIQEDGTYTVLKVPKGPVTITVDTKTAPGAPQGNASKSPQDRFKDMGSPGGGKAKQMPRPPDKADIPEAAKNNPLYSSQAQGNRYTAIPAKYADKDKSGLTLDCIGGKQMHDIRLD